MGIFLSRMDAYRMPLNTYKMRLQSMILKFQIDANIFIRKVKLIYYKIDIGQFPLKNSGVIYS